MGSIYRRGGVYWFKYYRFGERCYESSHSGNPAVARELCKQREGDIARGVPASPKTGKVTVEELLADVLADYQANGRRAVENVRRYIARLTRPGSPFEGRRAAHITASDVRAYILTRQQDTTANATINRELACLGRGYTLAIQAGKLAARPYIPHLREDNARAGFFEPDQFRAVLRHLPEHASLPARFLHATGWRLQSALGLRWADVSEEGIRIPGERTKNRRPLLFPWTTELRAVIAGARARVDRLQHERGAIIPWVFPREDGERLGDFKKSWKTACRRAGVPGRLRHDFRRTAARDLVRAGVPERQVMELLGWKTRAMLDRYHIVSQADLDAAATKIDRARGA